MGGPPAPYMGSGPGIPMPPPGPLGAPPGPPPYMQSAPAMQMPPPPPPPPGGTPVAGVPYMASGPMGGALAAAPTPHALPPTMGSQPAYPIPSTNPGAGGPTARPPGGPTITCPRCSTATPIGFAFCQHCGLHMQGMQPTDPAQMSPMMAPPPPPPPPPLPPVDVQAQTLAAPEGLRAGSILPPAQHPGDPSASPYGAAAPVRPPVSGVPSPAGAAFTAPPWGTAVLVNRDGSDGQRFPLSGEYLVVGRQGADVAFDDDRFLARQHARLERSSDGTVKVIPLDTLNGVYRKTDAPVDLIDGSVILVGREVLRFEKLDAEESKLHPLVRHGVALFGSPPREPWGRLVQLVPSGGYRDVRHLAGEEVVLGREDGDIVFRDDAFMSRRHAALTWNGQRAQLTDLGSSNGTFIRLREPQTLKSNDHVRMGDQLLRIELGR